MTERLRFVRAAKARQIPFVELCQLFDVSRKTGYKWLGRAEAGEPLEDRSRRPDRNSRAVEVGVADRLVQLREEYPTWGSRKLIGWLEEFEPKKWVLPAASTVTELLKRRGKISPRKRRQRLPPRSAPLAHAAQSNDVWCVDFKGDFLLGDGCRCYPLTVSDAYSRMLLCARALTTHEFSTVRGYLERTFREWGLPRRMRSDNGPPFGTRRTGPLSTLSVWLVKLGVLPEYTDPASPHQNGRHERMHLTLKVEATIPPGRDLRDQQRKLDRFRRIFNHERPHEALRQRPPVSAHRRSLRKLPSRIEDPAYPLSFERRRVDKRGVLHWRGHEAFLSEALGGEAVGLTEVDNGLWEIYFGPLVVARLHEAFDHLICRPRRIKVSPMSPV